MTAGRLLLSSAAALAIATSAGAASAFVPIPVGGHPGETDLMIRAGFERGLIEPNEFDGSWQSANWELFQLGVGHTIGTVGPLEFLWCPGPGAVGADRGLGLGAPRSGLARHSVHPQRCRRLRRGISGYRLSEGKAPPQRITTSSTRT
jgi:hypothetical protein